MTLEWLHGQSIVGIVISTVLFSLNSYQIYLDFKLSFVANLQRWFHYFGVCTSVATFIYNCVLYAVWSRVEQGAAYMPFNVTFLILYQFVSILILSFLILVIFRSHRITTVAPLTEFEKPTPICCKFINITEVTPSSAYVICVATLLLNTMIPFISLFLSIYFNRLWYSFLSLLWFFLLIPLLQLIMWGIFILCFVRLIIEFNRYLFVILSSSIKPKASSSKSKKSKKPKTKKHSITRHKSPKSSPIVDSKDDKQNEEKAPETSLLPTIHVSSLSKPGGFHRFFLFVMVLGTLALISVIFSFFYSILSYSGNFFEAPYDNSNSSIDVDTLCFTILHLVSLIMLTVLFWNNDDSQKQDKPIKVVTMPHPALLPPIPAPSSSVAAVSSFSSFTNTYAQIGGLPPLPSANTDSHKPPPEKTPLLEVRAIPPTINQSVNSATINSPLLEFDSSDTAPSFISFSYPFIDIAANLNNLTKPDSSFGDFSSLQYSSTNNSHFQSIMATIYEVDEDLYGDSDDEESQSVTDV